MKSMQVSHIDTASNYFVLTALCQLYAFLIPVWGLLGLHITLPSLNAAGVTVLSTRQGFELIIVMLFLICTPVKELSPRNVIIPLVAISWFVLITLRAALSPLAGHGAYQIIQLAQSLGIVAVGVVIANQPLSVRIGVLVGFLRGAAVVAAASYYQLFLGNIYFGGRLTYSAGANPAGLAFYYALSIIVCLYLHSVSERKSSWIFPLLFFALSLTLTQGRNAILGLLVSWILVIAWIPFIRKKSHRRMQRSSILRSILRGLLTAAIAVFAVVLLLPILTSLIDFELMTRRLLLLFSRDMDSMTASRWSIWAHYVTIIEKDSLTTMLWGRGAGMTQHEFMSPHNTYLQVLFEHGVIVLTIWITFMLSILYVYRRTGGADQLFAKWLVVFGTLIMIGNDFAYSGIWIVLAFGQIVHGWRWRRWGNLHRGHETVL